MKIVFLTHYSALYGANLALLYLATDLKRQFGCEVMIICPNDGEILKEAQSLGIEVYNFWFMPWRARRWNGIKRVLRTMWNPLSVFMIQKKIKTFNPDIIHNNSSLVDIGVTIATKLKKPCVWHLREFGENDYNLKYLNSKSYVSKMYSRADCLIAISNAVREHYNYDFPRLRIEMIYDGIQEFSVIKKNHSLVNFCCVGTMTEGKGQFDVIKATAELVEKYGTLFKVYLFGDGEKKYSEQLKKYVVDHDLNDIVVFRGYVSDIPTELETMDVGIMSSKCEAFGRVTVEYMYAKMGVIATDSGANKEILGNEAFYYRYGDYSKLASLMKFFIMDKNEAMEKGNRLHKIANERFTQTSNTEKIYELYTKLI
ncbi:glycosyltransferase family 4 protein [Butyrivibrio sp. MC2021]|uniref:glycosyltransferase family 4 protein n=1 Tax=Butyrivibrio sp. MC2021 TaxID=1408306 RepID=UPI00047E196F|nr:glycosyltransferase family 4 protein [Butyrivibrio sp. MC2021]